MFSLIKRCLGRGLILTGLLLLGLAQGHFTMADAQSQRVLVVVGEKPITDYDVTQRLRLNEALGYPTKGTAQQQRKEVLEELIDEVIKRTEAEKYKTAPDDKQVDAAINRMAVRMGSNRDTLAAKLKAKNIGMQTLKDQVAATLGFNWLMTRKFNVNVKVEPAEVDRRLATIGADPRLKPVQVYDLLEITLPVDTTSQANTDQVMFARAIEAQQIAKRFRGCRTAHKAIAGIYNVKLSKTIQAPGQSLPGPMKAALDKTGPGHVIGPMRTRQGVQLIAFCGRQMVRPPKPTRDIVKSMLLDEKYKVAAHRIMRDLRRNVFIDYKN